MNYWAQLANHHWKKFLPNMYHTYQDQGILDQELEKAGNRAADMIGQLIDQGLRPEEAKEIALPQTVLLTPESDPAEFTSLWAKDSIFGYKTKERIREKVFSRMSIKKGCGRTVCFCHFQKSGTCFILAQVAHRCC